MRYESASESRMSRQYRMVLALALALFFQNYSRCWSLWV